MKREGESGHACLIPEDVDRDLIQQNCNTWRCSQGLHPLNPSLWESEQPELRACEMKGRLSLSKAFSISIISSVEFRLDRIFWGDRLHQKSLLIAVDWFLNTSIQTVTKWHRSISASVVALGWDPFFRPCHHSLNKWMTGSLLHLCSSCFCIWLWVLLVLFHSHIDVKSVN